MNNNLQKIFIANDHAGLSLAQFLIKNNPQQQLEHLGTFNTQASDYPQQATLLCQKILKITDKNLNTPISVFGVLICGSGQGMAIQANRFMGIRAALSNTLKSCKLARQHNNVNVLCLGSRLLSYQKAHSIFTQFINTPFKGGRHLSRIQSLDKK